MLYIKIAKEITNDILSGVYVDKKRLPSELDLATYYKTSKMTIRRSLSTLIDSGVVFSIPKSGYYINSVSDIEKFNSLTGNGLNILNKNLKITFKIIHFEILKTPSHLFNKFNNNSNKVILIKRIRYINKKVSTLEITYLNYDLFKTLKKEDTQSSLYAYVSKDYTIATNLKTVRANFAPMEFITHLPYLENKPLLEIENTGYLTIGLVFEYSISYNIDKDFSTTIKYNNILK